MATKKLNKAVTLTPLAEGELLGRNRANALIALFNAFVNGTIVREDPAEILFGDNNITIKIGSATTSSGGDDDGGGGGGSGTVALYRFKSLSASTITCRTWDGTTEGGTDIVIAKPYKLWELSSEDIDGVTYDYAYSTNGDGNRVRAVTTTSDSLFFEQQIISPRYLLNDLIIAAPMPTGFVSGATQVDLNVDGRAWSSISGSMTQFTNL